MFRIVNSVSTQGPIDRLVNIGDIQVDSTDKTGLVHMKKIPYPHQVRDSLRDAYMAARDKRGTVLLENFR